MDGRGWESKGVVGFGMESIGVAVKESKSKSRSGMLCRGKAAMAGLGMFRIGTAGRGTDRNG